MSMHDKIALIGSDSFVARYVYQQLKGNCKVTGFSRRNILQLDNHIQFNYPERPIDFKMLFDFDTVIYCAGGGIQGKEEDESVYQLNTFLPISMSLYLNNKLYKGKLITFGSYFEIGNNSIEKEFDENDVITSNMSVPNHYCLSKRLLSRFFQGGNFSFKHYHLILPTIYGKGENSNRLIPYLVNTLMEGKEPNLTSGCQVRQYIHASDLSQLVEIIIKSEVASGVYNVPCYETVRISDLVKTIYSVFDINYSEKNETMQRYDESMQYLALNCAKIKNTISNWKPTISVASSINNYINQ